MADFLCCLYRSQAPWRTDDAFFQKHSYQIKLHQRGGGGGGEEDDNVDVEEEEGDDNVEAEDRSQDREAHLVRACAVEMHMDMSQEAFCADIYKENAGR